MPSHRMTQLERPRRLARQSLRRLFDRRSVWTHVRAYRRPVLNFGRVPIEPPFHVLARGYDPLFPVVDRSLIASTRTRKGLLAELGDYRSDSSELAVTHDPQGGELAVPVAVADDFRILTGGGNGSGDTDPFQTQLFLHFLVRNLRPNRVLELGTGHGVSGLHIIAALEENQCGQLTTVELDRTRRTVAISAFNRFFPAGKRWTSMQSSFAEALPDLAEDLAPIDIVFEDGPHTYDVTLQTFEQTIGSVKLGGLYIVDDIAFDGEQEKAWVAIRNDPRIGASIEINDRFGLCVKSAT